EGQRTAGQTEAPPHIVPGQPFYQKHPPLWGNATRPNEALPPDPKPSTEPAFVVCEAHRSTLCPLRHLLLILFQEPYMQFPEINVPGTGQLYARLKTNQGAILVQLAETRAPKTVANFCGLAT